LSPRRWNTENTENTLQNKKDAAQNKDAKYRKKENNQTQNAENR
jgi:hypothetical protein